MIFIFNIVPLFSLLKKEKPDYLIIHLLTSIPLILLLFFNFKTKFILRISGLPRLNFFRKILWKTVSGKLFLITCPSSETLEYLKKSKIFDNNKLVILHDPIINVSKINRNAKENLDLKKLKKNFFLSIGRLTKQKNHLLLIKFFSILKNEDLDFSLYILGEGEERNFLLKEIERLNLQDRVFFNAVPDFIDFHVGNFHWFIFNVSDIFITLGVISMIIFELLNKENEDR